MIMTGMLPAFIDLKYAIKSQSATLLIFENKITKSGRR
jgi:hypothetical protein